MSMIGKIRRMHFRQHKTLREISRTTSLSRNTVRKYLRMAQVQEPKYERTAKATKLRPFQEAIVTALKADARRPEARTAHCKGALRADQVRRLPGLLFAAD